MAFFVTPRHHNITSRANNAICIHLSAQILSSQFSSGMAEPGRVSKKVVMKSHPMAGEKRLIVFVNEIVSAILIQEKTKKKGAPDEAPLF